MSKLVREEVVIHNAYTRRSVKDGLGTYLMGIEGITHKIYMREPTREDILKEAPTGFILEVNDKRIPCYWTEEEFDIDSNDNFIWYLGEIGGSFNCSLNEFSTHKKFSSREEQDEAVALIKAVFSRYDNHTAYKEDDQGEIYLMWEKHHASASIVFSEELEEQLLSGELIEG